MSKLTSLLLALALIAGCHKSVRAQVSVAPATIPHVQFFSSNGTPLAGGKVFTYDAGTTTLRNTYKDGNGIAQNTNPIILNSGGFADIWLANQSYKFVVQNSVGVQQWSADNIVGYLGLLNLANTWTFPQTFTQPISITPTDNQIVLGQSGSQTIFDVPPSPSGTTLHFQTGADDTVVNRNTTETLVHKTLSSPTLNSPTENTPTVNGIQVLNGPGAYISVPNDTVNGTTLNYLAKLTTANPSAAIATNVGTIDTSGAVGVVVANAGRTGNALIQQSGSGFCIFDNAQTAGDYVQISGSFVGRCTDVGATYPTTGQVIGRVTQSAGSGPTPAPIILFGPEITIPKQSTSLKCSSGAINTVSVTSTSATALQSCKLTTAELNIVGRTIRITASVQPAPVGSSTNSIYWANGTDATLATANYVDVSASSAGAVYYRLSLTCTVATTGASGVMRCTDIYSAVPSSGTPTFTQPTVMAFNPIDLTHDQFLGLMCSFGTPNAGNTCTVLQFSIELLN